MPTALVGEASEPSTEIVKELDFESRHKLLAVWASVTKFAQVA
eukprot:CAMPEP_0184544504 /NCGR_PEP_ID=MMETSP0199_2-20130426/3666_1 /TAXON_ID=1112570 /ORGANISM="Thraustochytrium sp., Strain LLF1b" /LENGTH=42 /DNA_ID= /DNA_START= /DNA_END= /DNA_ORIENTATION=